MNPKLALAMVLVLVGPAFSGCIDGGQEDPTDTLDRLVAQAPQCKDEPNSATQGTSPSSGDDIVGQLSYATDEDRTLIRWIPPSGFENATVTVTRKGGGSTSTDTVTPITDPTKAQQVLDTTDPRWPALSQTLVDAVNRTRDAQGANRTVETVPDLVSFLHNNQRFAQVFAQRYYPVAIVLGHAYLDTAGQDGTTYTYDVEASQDGDTKNLGSVDVTTGQLTPLTEPRNPTCVSLEQDTTLRAQPGATWGELQQQQRVLHLKVLLRWDPPNVDFRKPERVNGYDVYRAEVPENPSEAPQSLEDLDYERVTDDPVQPRPTDVTTPPGTTNASSAAVDFYHVDETPSAGTWIYRVAPRDILGTPRDPAQHSGQLSEPVVATSFDFEPPKPPANATANQTANNSAVLVNWTHPNITFVPGAGSVSTQSSHIGGVGGGIGDVDVPDTRTLPELPKGEWVVDEDSDLSHFAVYRSRNASARPPSPIDAPPHQRCTDETRCWVHIGNTTSAVFLDNETLRGQARWYQVRAIDESETGNPSAWAGPVHETLHDETPPPAPELGVDESFVDPDMGGESQAAKLSTDRTYGPMLTVRTPSGDDDTTRSRIQCRFEGNQTWVRIATVPLEDGIENVPLSDHYDPPTKVEAECRARSADAHGNIGDPSSHVNTTFGGRGGSQALPQPVLITAQFGRYDPALSLEKVSISSRTETTRVSEDSQSSSVSRSSQEADMRDQLQGVGVHGVRLNWSMPDIANLDELEVVRTDPKDETETTWRVDADRRTAVDVDVVPGTTYEYKIRAIPRDTDNEPTESLPLESGVTQSPQWADVDRPERPLGHIDLTVHNNPSRDAVTLDWMTRDDDRRNRYFAVFRSVERDRGYIQQTPIQTFGPPVTPDGPYNLAWKGNFTDEDVYRNYWYTVVEFDRRTGEPIRASDPKASSNMLKPDPAPDWSDVHLRSGIRVSKGSCQAQAPSPGETVAMAEGFTLTVTSFDRRGGSSADGTGEIEVETSRGPTEVEVDFRDLSVESTPPGEPRAACQGIASQDLNGRSYPSDGFPTRLHDLVLGPSGDNAIVDAVVDLPENLRYFDGTRTRGSVPLDNVSIHADETVTFDQAIQGDCRNPGFGFKLQTAPVQVVPTGQVRVSQTEITFGSACTEHNVSAWNSERLKVFLGRGRNDGYLEPTLHNQGAVTVTTDGLQGRFKNATLGSTPVQWRTSSPQGFDVEVEGSIEVRFDQSRVAGGSLTDGSLSFSHFTESNWWATSDRYDPDFAQLDLVADGQAKGTVSLDRPVEWTSLSVDPDQWGLLLGAVTFDGNPGRDIIATLPGDTVDAGPLGDAYLNPGLNLRSASETLRWTCSSGSSFDTAMDAHLRRGGMNHAFRALIAGSTDIDIHGYDGSVRTWSRAFLDNSLMFHETVGKLQVPAPSDVTFDLDPMELTTDGCIKGGSGLGEKTLDYWNMTTRVDALEFRTPDQGVPHDGDALLFAQGTYEVPHLDPSGSGGSTVPAEYAFLPGGDVDRSRLLLDEPLHEVDGYPFLLEGFRLSDHDKREAPGWEPKANIEEPPDHTPADEGFLELEGRLITPYFGKLTSDSGEAPKLRFTSDDHYLGFDRRPRVEKTWVDVDEAQLVWAFDLVYVQDPDDEAGKFTAFESYEFLPLGVLFKALEKPKDVVRAGFDRAGTAVDTGIQEARHKVAVPFQKIRQGQKQIVGDVRTQVLQGLDSAHGDVTDYIDRYFEQVRAKINATGPSGATAAELQQNVTKDAFHWFTQVVRPVQDALLALEDFRENELQSILDTLLEAQEALTALQTSSVDTHRLLRSIVDQLQRATDLLGPDLGKLPRNLGNQIPVNDIVNKLQAALSEAENLEKTYANALGNIQPALDTLSTGVATLRSTLEKVDAAIGDMVTVGNRALAELRNARDTVASLVPDQTSALTATVKQSLLQETYRLQSAVKSPVDTVHQRIRTQFTKALDTLDQRFQKVVDDVHRQVDRALQRLGNNVQDQLDNLEQEVVDAVDDAISQIESVLDKLRLVYLDASPVIEPGQFSAFLGLASAVAAVRSAEETLGSGTSWSGLSGDEQDRWRNRIGWDGNRKPYGNVYDDVSFSSGQDHTDSVDAVDTWLETNEPPEDEDVGAGTGGLLADWGVDIREGRGSVVSSQVGDPQEKEVQVDEIKLRVKATLGDPDSPAFHADVVGMNIDRHGEYYVFGRGIETKVVKKDLSADVDLLINTSEPRFEGGLTVYDFDIEQVYVAEAGAAVGVGETILYVGVKFEGIISTGGSQIGVGGVVLGGRVDATSPILNHHFPDAMDRVKDVPAKKSSGSEYVGMYVTAHFDMPLPPLIGAEFGCVLDLNVGGRLGLWYFQQPSGSPPPLTFGIKLGGYSYGTVVCAIDARGEITVTFSFAGTIPPGKAPQGQLKVKGTTWVAAGVGDCSPGTWKGWNDRWWGDSWCAQGGAYAEIVGTGPLPFDASEMDVDPHVEADAEGPF